MTGQGIIAVKYTGYGAANTSLAALSAKAASVGVTIAAISDEVITHDEEQLTEALPTMGQKQVPLQLLEAARLCRSRLAEAFAVAVDDREGLQGDLMARLPRLGEIQALPLDIGSNSGHSLGY